MHAYGKAPRVAGSLGRETLWRWYRALEVSLGLQEPYGIPHFLFSYMAHAQVQGGAAILSLGILQEQQGKITRRDASFCSTQDTCKAQRAKPLGWQMISLRVVIGNSVLYWGKSSPAFSMPNAINRGCAVWEAAVCLAFALCGAEVISKYLFLLGIGRTGIRNKQPLARAARRHY